MDYYKKYTQEIKERNLQGLSPKPIENKELIDEIILQITDHNNKYRTEAIDFFIYKLG